MLSPTRVFQGTNSTTEKTSKRLILMRHGDETQPEILKQQVQASLASLLEAYPDLKIDAVMYSPATRTKKTTEALLESLKENSITPNQISQTDWLAEDTAPQIGLNGFREKTSNLDENLQTVFMVTHSTSGPLLAHAINTQADEWTLAFGLCSYAGIMVLNIQSENWKSIDSARRPNVTVDTIINGNDIIRAPQITQATEDFRNSL